MKVHHFGVEVVNLEKSIDFYQDFFDFKLEQKLYLEPETLVFLTNGTARIELVWNPKNTKKISELAHIAWEVKHINEWIQRLEKKNLFPIEDPIDLDNGWSTVFYRGWNGEIIELIST
ncbi:VOC family protein [Radiobacillus kanasensis]|uniref:VOC family protein n=1 Tax=Radiobacillus kanasensis TaxID=2844358 RepID=UPI001E524F6B|nr:VOC family protein [Radiobacillus kanasensis]UFT99161.1 VOC family protein [Radiobacillus kanasensis]